MTGGAMELALRRQRLLIRSAALRDALAEQAAVLDAPFAAADRARAGVHWLVRQRAWLGVGLVFVLAVRPRRAWRLLGFGWRLWRRARRVRPWLAAAGLIATAGARVTGAAKADRRPGPAPDRPAPSV